MISKGNRLLKMKHGTEIIKNKRITSKISHRIKLTQFKSIFRYNLSNIGLLSSINPISNKYFLLI